MTRQGIEEYRAAMRARYQGVGRTEKGAWLTEFCAMTGYQTWPNDPLHMFAVSAAHSLP
jgi:hypothetical protein